MPDLFHQYDDNTLLSLLQKGDGNAYTLIFEEYHRELYRFAYRYLLSKEMAEDVIQNLFVYLWNERANLGHIRNLKNYLYTAVKNRVLNLIRNNNTAVRHAYYLSQNRPVADEKLLPLMENPEMIQILDNVARHFKEPKKTIYHLKIHEQKKNAEIAEMLGISYNTVKTHWTQIIALLKKHVNSHLKYR